MHGLERWGREGALKEVMFLQDPYSNSLVSDPLEEVSGRYYSRLAAALHYRPKAANAAAPPMVYTALHGVGTPWVQQVGAAWP